MLVPFEVITRIEEFEQEWEGYDKDAPLSGYMVETNKQVIIMGIDNQQDCCEVWGYLWSNEKPEDFIGATLLSIDTVGESMNKERFDPGTEVEPIYDEDGWMTNSEEYYKWCDAPNCMFINLETDRGTLQFIAYNGHNGYYAHIARVISKQLDFQTTL